MKKVFVVMIIGLMMFSASGCGKTKVLHCDGCKKEVKVSESSNMEENWSIFCEDCNKDLLDE